MLTNTFFDAKQSISIVEATIDQLQDALSTGQTNSVELTAKHLIRIAKYDRRGPRLNALPIINQHVFKDAQAADDRRADGKADGGLEGIPCTIKDSYKIKGLTVASGSPAFQDLVATTDAFTVEQIKNAGAVILAKSNMPPMAAGGMQRGVYGRAESPYNKDYLTGAFASGSSNGSGTATSASFGVFGMGEETISSGRSPASNNGLVAYTPSRGLISIRGNWPLFPTCDTVVPHTRTVKDMFRLLDVIVREDGNRNCDFWRGQPFVPLPEVDAVRPKSYQELQDPLALDGKRIGVPKMYVGKHDPNALPVHVNPTVVKLWEKSRATLESLGATVVEVDFPIVNNFEKGTKHDPAQGPYFTPLARNDVDMCQLMAYAWDDFLVDNAASPSTLADVDPELIFPQPPGSLKDRYGGDDPLAQHAAVVAQITNGRIGTYDIPGLKEALESLEARRKSDFERWLDEQNLHAVVWPCAGDVGRADADVNEDSAREAWRNGVLYSNGNCVIRQCGIPTVNVTMGLMEDTKMPVNLTFATKAYQDNDILRYAYAFEAGSKARIPPPRTPQLETDTVPLKSRGSLAKEPPTLTAQVESSKVKGGEGLAISGSVSCDCAGGLESLEVFVDGEAVSDVNVEGSKWSAKVERPSTVELREKEKAVPALNTAMIVVTASAKNGRSAGQLLFA
ncbi:hypothetical protein A1O1_04249 [Capronia coronata CBS 617.96]|uniref:Amidase domain-containing protein n=1 Tax=Capronia coronata CBS 617.96 TaxID=1182541 RepID=W9YN78_9EURO|nr:uncharacterized protein A1O1_04249 [Capronia coronata CBS 617.96]EXJ91140.1 hypothetical protein A1O1_04249 [Capronia coronata CBS 617.96]